MINVLRTSWTRSLRAGVSIEGTLTMSNAHKWVTLLSEVRNELRFSKTDLYA